MGLFDYFKERSLFNKMVDLKNQGRFDEALECLDKILEMNPENIPALYDKGKISEITGNYETALMYYDNVLNLDPENLMALDSHDGPHHLIVE